MYNSNVKYNAIIPYISSRAFRITQPPRPQRQSLQLHSRRPYIRPKRHNPHNDTDYVSDVIPISGNSTSTSAVGAAMFLGFCDAGEGLGDESCAVF